MHCIVGKDPRALHEALGFLLMMAKYLKGSFITVPNKDVLRGQPPAVQALFMWLCHYANSTGDCFPSRETLAKDAGLSLASVKRSMNILTNLGIVIREPQYNSKRQTTNLYSILIGGSHRAGGGCPSEPPEGLTQSHRTQPIGSQSIGTQKRVLSKKESKAANALLREEIRKVSLAAPLISS